MTRSCVRKTVIFVVYILLVEVVQQKSPDPRSVVASKERVCLSICAFITHLFVVCSPRNSLIFLALAVQISIPKYYESPGQFYPLLQPAKRINYFQIIDEFIVDNFS